MMARLDVDRLFESSDKGLFRQGPKTPSPGSKSPFSGLFGHGQKTQDPGRLFRGPEPERGYYISGDRLADFVGEFDKAIEKEEADPQFLRAWAALMDFEGAQRTEMRGALDWITPSFRFWSTFGLAGLYILMRQLKRLGKLKPQGRTRPQPQTQTQARAPSSPSPPQAPAPGTPQTGPPEAQVKEAARSQKPKCEICNVELIELDASTAVCPGCNHEYRRG